MILQSVCVSEIYREKMLRITDAARQSVSHVIGVVDAVRAAIERVAASETHISITPFGSKSDVHRCLECLGNIVVIFAVIVFVIRYSYLAIVDEFAVGCYHSEVAEYESSTSVSSPWCYH